MIPTDPLRTLLLPVLEACPLQAGSLYTSYKDLSLSVEWHDLRAMVLPETGWSVIIGHKKQEDPLRVVVPLPLHTTALRPSVLKSIFDSLATLDTSTLPGADEPLIPSVEAVQKEMRSRRKEEEEDTDSPFDMVSPTEAEGAESGKIADGRKELVGQEIDREIIYLAIVTSDSTVVYYKLSKGIKKPADIPDE